MSKGRILVVDDEQDIANMLKIYFTGQGYDVEVANRGSDALDITQKQLPQLIVLDINLPDTDGYTLFKQMRTQTRTKHIPVIFLTEKDDRSARIAGLELGAEDYVTKPFSPRVLVARANKVLRRSAQPGTKSLDLIQCNEMVIDIRKHEVTINGRPVTLTYTEFEVLTLLAGRPGWAFSRSQIVDNVRGYNYSVTDRSVDVQIVGLRRKLGSYGRNIQTVRGVGYRFRDGAQTGQK